MPGTAVAPFHPLRVGAAVVLCALGAACADQPSAPGSAAGPPQAAVLRIARARVIEPGDLAIGTPPEIASWARAGAPPRSSTAFDAAANRAWDPTTGHLHELDPSGQMLREISRTGQLVATRDVSEFRLRDPRGMTFAATSDATDDPSALSLYVSAGGQVTELSLAEPVAAAAATVTATLVRTTNTAAFSPPSPDPSGLAYASHLGRLMVADGEVNEMPIYAGANIFETTLAGSLSSTWTTLSFSGEPVGEAYDPVSRHLFISDDDKRLIFEVNGGADGRYGTADDQVRSVDTRQFGSDDPEGLAYDPAHRALFIADGVNAQVYRISFGANGVLDGLPPAGDDQLTSFDTEAHGLVDPEGMAYDTDLGLLYVVGKPATLVFEFSTTGTPLGTIDISAAQAHKPAGLEYVPASASSGSPMLYIVDRGVDNNTDPKENDGKLYQFALPSSTGNASPTVTISSPADGSTFTRGDAITFTGTATDAEDGSLTAGLTWTSSRDGALGSGGTISTSALSAGTHTITASVTDAGGAPGSASITVTVNEPGSGNLVLVRVAAGSDDAEESAAGKVTLTSSRLELVYDKSNQTVGLRFTGVTLPPGATIVRAYVQFQAQRATSEATALTVGGEAADNAATFTTTARISARPRTASSTAWAPPPWTASGQAGTAQQTPDLAPIIQEIINRPGWRSGNSIVLIITGSGRRIAQSYEGSATAAPLLHVEISTTGETNSAPAATNVTISGTPQVGQVLTGTYTYTDAEGDPEGSSTYRWLRDGAPISGASTRSYTLVAADQGRLIRFEVTPVAATGASPGAPTLSPTVGPVTTASTSTSFAEARVAASSDDAEESSGGSVSLTSTDLELVLDSSNQTVGMRFNGVAVPPGATITRAYVQFQVDEATVDATSLTVSGQAADNPVTFSSSANVSARPRTGSTVSWVPAPWPTVGQAGADQQTPNLASIIQEIVDRVGWRSGNSMVLIVTGSGKRVAEAFDGTAAAAPLLRIEFSVGTP